MLELRRNIACKRSKSELDYRSYFVGSSLVAGGPGATHHSFPSYLRIVFIFLFGEGRVKNRMPRFPWRGLLLACFWCAIFFAPSVMAQDPAVPPAETSDPLVSHQTKLEHWLALAGLSKYWVIEKLRWGSNPSPIATDNHDVLRLELRLRDVSGDQNTGDQEFQRHLDAYEREYGESAPERIFYRLIHECQVGRRDAVVTLRIVRQDYVVFFDPARGEVLLQPREDRSISREVPLDLTSLATGPRLQSSLRTANLPDRQALSESMRAFLRDYFTSANRRANMPDPKFDSEIDNRDHDHVGFVISGIKSQVLRSRNYWEMIDISLDVVQAPSGVKLLCHIDGYYAGGLGRRLPDEDAYEDMRKGFQDQLRIFADGLLSQLQKRIETGR